MFVRSGIRTHAHRSGLRPERSALDRSAILTYWTINQINTCLFYSIFPKPLRFSCDLRPKLYSASKRIYNLLGANDLSLNELVSKWDWRISPSGTKAHKGGREGGNVIADLSFLPFLFGQIVPKSTFRRDERFSDDAFSSPSPSVANVNVLLVQGFPASQQYWG